MKNKFNLDFSKIKFEINWASGITIVTLLMTTITLYMNNKSLQNKVEGLEKSNGTLSEAVNVLKGSQEITNGAIQAFMQNPPSELKYRLDRLEQVVEQKLNVEVGVRAADHPFENKNLPK